MQLGPIGPGVCGQLCTEGGGLGDGDKVGAKTGGFKQQLWDILYRLYIYTLLQFNIVMEESQLKMLKTQGNHVLMGDFPLQGWITEGDVHLSTPIGMISNWLLLLRGLKPPARTWASNRNSTHNITPERPYPIRNSYFQRCSNQLFYLHVEFQACISIGNGLNHHHQSAGKESLKAPNLDCFGSWVWHGSSC